MRFTASFLKLILCWWTALFACKSIVELSVDWRYHNHVPVFPPEHIAHALLVPMLLAFTILIWFKIDQLTTKGIFYNCKSQKNKFSPYLLTALNICFLSSLIYSLSSFVWYTGGTLAYAADTIGAFELGERIYAVMVHTNDRSLATVSARGYDDKRYREQEDARLDNIVARVYGANSRQMAFRYLVRGFNCESNFYNYRLAEEYFKKSLLLYQNHQDHRMCVRVLSSLSFAQYQTHEISKLKGTLVEADQELRVCSPDPLVRQSLTLLWFTAKEIGDKGQADVFYQRQHQS